MKAEVLLSLLDPLNEKPHDQAHQRCFHRANNQALAPTDAQCIVDAPAVLNDGVAHGVFLTVAKHVDADHGGKPVAQLTKHHAQHHRVSEQGFVGEELHRMITPNIGFFLPLLDTSVARKNACTVTGESKLSRILLPLGAWQHKPTLASRGPPKLARRSTHRRPCCSPAPTV